jgi:hypothetical protein
VTEYLEDYSVEIRDEIALTLNATPRGEWAELALCPGPFGCPCPTRNDFLPAGVEPAACDSCRVIHLYRPV